MGEPRLGYFFESTATTLTASKYTIIWSNLSNLNDLQANFSLGMDHYLLWGAIWTILENFRNVLMKKRRKRPSPKKHKDNVQGWCVACHAYIVLYYTHTHTHTHTHTYLHTHTHIQYTDRKHRWETKKRNKMKEFIFYL